MVIEAKTKKWGNSIGIVIPFEVTERLNLKPQETILIDVSRKENVLKELFGAFKTSKSTEEMLKGARKDLEGKWLR